MITMTNNENEFKILKLQVKYYLDKKSKLHLVLMTGKFRNGYIVSIDEEKIVFKDKVFGEEPIPYSMIYRVEPYVDGGIY